MALIAYLMEYKGNYGPHLIIVPNAVLVNWKVSLSLTFGSCFQLFHFLKFLPLVSLFLSFKMEENGTEFVLFCFRVSSTIGFHQFRAFSMLVGKINGQNCFLR